MTLELKSKCIVFSKDAPKAEGFNTGVETEVTFLTSDSVLRIVYNGDTICIDKQLISGLLQMISPIPILIHQPANFSEETKKKLLEALKQQECNWLH